MVGTAGRDGIGNPGMASASVGTANGIESPGMPGGDGIAGIEGSAGIGSPGIASASVGT